MAETEILFSFQKSSDGGYEARALGHSIFAQAKTMDGLRANVKDAVACHFGDRMIFPSIRLVKVRGRAESSAQRRASSQCLTTSTIPYRKKSKTFFGNESFFFTDPGELKYRFDPRNR